MDSKSAAFNKTLRDAAEPRRKRAVALREAGETWTTIGQILGVSRQRAQQLGAAANGKKRKAA